MTLPISQPLSLLQKRNGSVKCCANCRNAIPPAIENPPDTLEIGEAKGEMWERLKRTWHGVMLSACWVSMADRGSGPISSGHVCICSKQPVVHSIQINGHLFH